MRSTAHAVLFWVISRHFLQLRVRRCAAALVVAAVHVAAFLSMRDELLRQRSSPETPVFISLFVPTEMPRRPSPGRPRPNRTERARTLAKSGGVPAPKAISPRRITPPPVDWLGEAQVAARNQVASEADRKRRTDWLSRGTDPETHPLVLAMKPLFGKTPEFGWSHEHTHRIEHPPGGPLVFWINKRCAIAFFGFAIIGGCAIGHMEPNGALFEHMSDADLDFTPAP